MKLKPETVGFVRGGMLFLEPPHRWRAWQRDVWLCCCRSPVMLAGERLSPLMDPAPIITISTPYGGGLQIDVDLPGEQV